MNIYLIIFAIIASIFLALLEIQIEGENGWASKLPTWRFKNPFHKVFNWPYITGYHIFLNLFLVFILQLPFFVGIAFNSKNEKFIGLIGDLQFNLQNNTFTYKKLYYSEEGCKTNPEPYCGQYKTTGETLSESLP